MHRRSPADDRADPRTNSLAPDPAPREHGSCTIQITHIQYPIQQTITYNTSSLHSKHPPWHLHRPAHGMRPRGPSRQRNGEGWTGSARGGGGCFGSGEWGGLGWRADIHEGSDWGSHELGVDDLLNLHGTGAVYANQLQVLAISTCRS